MERDIVAVFGAHPDDLDWAAGGTTAVWAKQGKEVYYVLTTNGESGEDHIGKRKLSRAEMADIREAEQRIAASVLGVKEVVFLGLPDGRLEPNLQLRDCLVNVLRRLKPNIVISLEPTQGGFDNFYLYHPDHRATAHNKRHHGPGNGCNCLPKLHEAQLSLTTARYHKWAIMPNGPMGQKAHAAAQR